MTTSSQRKNKKESKPSLFSLLQPYKGMIAMLIIFALLSNGLNLLIPKLIEHGIDDYTTDHLLLKPLVIKFSLAAFFIFLFTYLQSIVQTYASERVAKDLRTKLSNSISRQSFAFIQQKNPNVLLTNLTSDIDSIKMFVSQAVVSITSSLFIIIGASILLLTIQWKLALAVLTIIPIIAFTFFSVLKKVRPLFGQSRRIIDRLNKVINESILGSALIRVLNAQLPEYDKFVEANTEARNLGISIVRLFALLIPVITFTANMALLTILVLGGHFVIIGTMTLGSFAAFNSYLSILIFPIIVIGFMSNIIAQASASYNRIYDMLDMQEAQALGTVEAAIAGNISVQDVSLYFKEKPALKNISFTVKAGSRTAIIGPTGSGKTQLLYLLTGLIAPQSGTITYDEVPINQYNPESLLHQVGLVFQDSITFNISLKENIAFNEEVNEENLQKAIDTAEMSEFIATLPEQLDTMISERGTSLSGGQKQRMMLARALAIHPKVLLLDDFTARVDTLTEQRILQNVRDNYPGITLVSVTQKIAPVTDYDQIILLMEGEIIASGTHPELMQGCPEYVQIYNSQKSTTHYELQSK